MGNSPQKLFNLKEDDMPVDIKTKGLRFKIHKSDEELTGWQRIKNIFELDIYGEITPELMRCKDTVLYTFLFGAVIGGVGRSRVAYQNFFRSNMHTAFETPMQARVKLQEAVFMGFGSGALRLGWRVAAFSAIYAFSSTALTVYRGKSSVFDPAVGGACAGFFYKFQQGPKLMIAGTVIGGLLGLLGGGLMMGTMAIFGVSPDEVLAYNRQAILDKRIKDIENAKGLQTTPPQKVLNVEQFYAELLSEPNSELSPEKSNTSQSQIQLTFNSPQSETQAQQNALLKN